MSEEKKLISQEDLHKVFDVKELLESAEQKIKNIKIEMSKVVLNSNLNDSLKEVEKHLSDLGTKSKFADSFKKAFEAGNIKEADKALKDLTENHKTFSSQAKEDKWNENIKNLQQDLELLKSNSSLRKLAEEADIAEKELRELSDKEFKKLLDMFNAGIKGAGDMSEQFKKFNTAATQPPEAIISSGG